MAAAIYIIYQLMSTLFANNYWVIRKPITGFQVLAGIWWTIKSVLFEELLFRGALLYLVMEKWGVKKPVFSLRFVSNLPLVFFQCFWKSSPDGHYILYDRYFWFHACLFFCTDQVFISSDRITSGMESHGYCPFSGGPLQQNIFVKANSNHLEGILSLFVFLFQIFALPVLVYYYLRFAKGKHHSSRGLKP